MTLLTSTNNRLIRALMGGGAKPAGPAPLPNPLEAPFTGLKNEIAPLPPFEAPGTQSASVMPWRGLPEPPKMPPVTVTAQVPPAPQPPVEVPPMPEPQQVGFPAVQQDVIKAVQELAKRNLLPEQWKGAFSPQYGEPL